MNSSLVCVDASIIVDLLTDLDSNDQLLALWEGWRDSEAQLVAPQLLRYEATNALYRMVKKGALSHASASDAISVMIGLPIQLYNDAALHNRAYQIAQELALGATYDAHYLALADQLRCELWTRDGRLARAAQELSLIHI